MRENFEAQFEAAGEGRYLYRRNQKGEPIPVSAEERERFIRQYGRSIWSVLGGMMAAIVVFWALVIWWTLTRADEFPDVLMYIGTAVIAILAIAMMYWIRGAPARQLAGRTPIGRERTSEEMRTLYMSKTTYGQLAAAGGVGVFLIVTRALREHSDRNLHWLYLVLGGGLVLFAAIRAFQKWRFDNDHRGDVI